MNTNFNVNFKRKKAWANKFSPFDIIVDGQKIGRIKEGENKDIEILTGIHEFFIRVPWSWHRSKKLTFDIKFGKQYIFICKGSTGSGFNPFLNFWYVFVDFNNYLVLEILNDD